jgi:hypothetical protein
MHLYNLSFRILLNLIFHILSGNGDFILPFQYKVEYGSQIVFPTLSGISIAHKHVIYEDY